MEYSAQTTLKAFQASAAEGEIAVVNALTGAIIPGTGPAAAATDRLMFALKRDGNTELSVPFLKGATKVSKLTYVAPVAQVTTVTTTAPTAVNKGDYSELMIVETTAGWEPLPRWGYNIEAKAGETWTQLMQRLVDKINNPTTPENIDKSRIVTAALTGSNITLTANSTNTIFTVALRGVLAAQGSAAVTTAYKLGQGTPEQAALAENYGDIYKGIGHFYPAPINATAQEFGVPTSFAAANGSTTQYTVYVHEFFAEEHAFTLQKEERKSYIFVYGPSNGATNPSAELDLILGF